MNPMLFIGMPRCERPTRSGRMKWKFRSELAALMVVHGFTRGKSTVLYVYDCPYCDGWHMTRQEQR